MEHLENNIVEYLNGNLSKTECLLVEEWVDKSDENRIHFEQIKKIYDSSSISVDLFDPNVDKAWSKVENQLFDKPKGKQVMFNLNSFYRVAAVIFIALSIGLISYSTLNDDLKTIATGNGQIREVLLADGTVITLNKNSEIQFDEDFDNTERVVHLVGQAFFDVSRDESRPFTILGESATVNVLGTSFDFVSVKGRSQVNVNSGTVSFASNEDPDGKLTLEKGEQGKLENDLLSSVDTIDSDAVEWRFEDLIFSSAPLSEIAKVVSKHHKVEFKFDGAIESCLISSSFKGQSLDDILKTLELIAGIKNARVGNVITLSGKGC